MHNARIISRKRAAFSFVLILAFAVVTVDVAKPETLRQRVFIRSNGNVEPASAPIHRNGEVYSFNGDVYAELVVERAGVVIDGAGYTLHGPYNGTRENLWVIGEGSDQVQGGTQIPYSIGVDLGGDASGLTIMNLNIKNFSIGTYIWTTNNLFVGNGVTECVVGVLLSGHENNVTKNYLARNEVGLFFGTDQGGNIPLTLLINQNCFQSNIRQLGGCLCEEANLTEAIHTWDDGREGNYWSDYNGTDSNGDGIGDSPYVVDVLNQDRYPLMESPASPPVVGSGITAYFVVALLAVGILTVISVAFWSVKRKRKRTRQGIPDSDV